MNGIFGQIVRRDARGLGTECSGEPTVGLVVKLCTKKLSENRF